MVMGSEVRRFSIGEAIGDGFRLIRRHPLAVFVWGVVLALPLLAVVPLFLEIWGVAGAAEGGRNPEAEAAMMSRIAGFQGVSALANIGQLLGGAVVATAIMRAVWSDHARDRWAFLRLGMDEVRVGVTFLAVVFGLYALMIVATLMAVALGAIVFAVLRIDAGWLVVPLMIALMIGFLLSFARVALIPVASGWSGAFAFVEGWNAAGEGRWLKLAALQLATMLIAALIVLPVQLLILAAVLGWLATQTGSEQGLALDAIARIDATVIAICLAIGFPVVAAMLGVQQSLVVGALASAWRQLVEGDA